jgi:hypothetical protein
VSFLAQSVAGDVSGYGVLYAMLAAAAVGVFVCGIFYCCLAGPTLPDVRTPPYLSLSLSLLSLCADGSAGAHRAGGTCSSGRDSSSRRRCRPACTLPVHTAVHARKLTPVWGQEEDTVIDLTGPEVRYHSAVSSRG